MFFSISHHPDTNFSHQWHSPSLVVNTDAGWNQTVIDNQLVVYKGYAESGALIDLLPAILQQSEPTMLGNFCAIVIGSNTLKIKTDRYRSFPIWVNAGKEITNLQALSHTVWTNIYIESDLNLNIVQHKFNVIGKIDTTPISESDALDQIDQILLTRTANFVKYNTLPIRSFLTGGVDSLLVYSYLVRVNAPVEVIDYLHIDYDHFWKSNSHHLKKFWGYSQIHHWNEPTVLASGAPGDEFMLRSPTTASMYLQFHQLNIPDLLQANPTCLHHSYFNQAKNLDAIQRPYAVARQEQMAWDICNILVNDWQHWHIGNTLTWTLLRDIEVLKLLLRLPIESAIGQILNSDLSNKLTERNLPGSTVWISDQKNTGAMRKNLTRPLKIRNDL